MDIQYGEKIKTTPFVGGKEMEEVETIRVRDKVKTDSEELALFIQLQKRANGKPAVFTRELRRSPSGNMNRYVVREWEV